MRATSCLVWIAVVLLATAASGVTGAPNSACLAGATDPPPSEVNVAVLVWVDSDELLLSQPLSSYPPIPSTSAGFQTSAPTVLQPFYLTVDFYSRLLAGAGGKVPVRGGTHHIKLNIHNINLGRIDWTKIAGGYPVDAVATMTAAARPGGLYDRLITNASSILGANRTFTFFIPNPLMSSFALTLANKLEDQQLGIIVHPYLTSAEAYICDGLPLAQSMTPDCTSPLYNRQRFAGARRFETLFGVFPDLSYDSATTLDLFHTMGIKRVAVFRDSPPSSTYSKLVLTKALEYADEVNIQVVLSSALKVVPVSSNECTVDTINTASSTDHCPPGTLLATQNQVWPDGISGYDLALKLRDLDVEGVILIGGTGTAGAWSFAQLVRGMQDIDYTPKMLSWVGAFEKTTMHKFLRNGKSDMLHTTGEIVWNRNLRGAAFRPVTTTTNFELIETNATHSVPAIFVDKFDSLYGPNCASGECISPASPGHAHPFWNGNIDGGAIPAISYSAFSQVQKLVEVAASDNVPRILASMQRVDTPAIFHQLAFDGFGRARKFDVVVTQYAGVGVTDDTNILMPINIGISPVFPMPTWSERVFQPSFYATTTERFIVGLSAALIAVVLVVFVAVMRHVKRPVIRATTPSFSALITLGAVLMLISNFFNTLHTNDSHCGAQVWCLTLGLTLMLSSLFAKTFRIWRIFATKRLQVVVMRDMDLFKAVCGFLLIDVLFNIIWHAGDGMKAKLVVVDPLRPSLNYHTCDYSSGVATGMMFAHIAYKAVIILGGTALTWAARNVPSSFNESTMISACIYNVLFMSCFIVPLVGTGVGGRSIAMLVRALAVMFVALMTPILLYAPKLYLIATNGEDALQHANAVDTQLQNTATSDRNTAVGRDKPASFKQQTRSSKQPLTPATPSRSPIAAPSSVAATYRVQDDTTSVKPVSIPGMMIPDENTTSLV